MRILLLEDNATLRETVAEALEDEGYSVLAVERGLEAVEASRRERFDLMVTDIRMEGMNGLEALARVQAEQPGLPGLVVTGYACEEDLARAQCLAAGFLRKPYDLQLLLDLVAGLGSMV